MAHRAAKFVSAISAGLVVSVPLATIPLRTVEAAEECLTRPGEPAPPGQHWYYAIDRGSKRRCWHLQPETSSHASISRRARRAAIVASREREPALPRATADAYAEFGLPQGRDEDAPHVSQQTLIASDYPKGAGPDQPDSVPGEKAPSVVALRWPEPAGVPAASSEPAPASFVVASATPDEKPEAGTEDLAPKAPPVVLTSAETSGTPASLKSLLLATFGAITISGFAGSSVYLLAQRRRRPQSHASLSHGPPSAEWVDRTRPPPWLYRDGAHEAGAASLDRLRGGLDEMGSSTRPQ